MRYYDHRLGVVSDVRPARAGMSGCHGLGCLDALGAEGCAAILAEVRRLQGLAKTRSKKEHRKAASTAAAAAMQRYQQCVASAARASTPIVPLPVSPVSTSPEPMPYVPMVGGGGGGGSSSYPEMTPIPDGADNSTLVVIPHYAPPPAPGQITQTSQFTSTGQPIFYNAENGQTFYYGPTGHPVYFTQAVQPSVSTVTQQPQLYTDPSTGRQFYYDPATGQQVYTTPADGTGQQLASQALTPVSYVQMPSGGRGGDGELVPYEAGASFMPQASAFGQPSEQQYTINERDLIAQNGPTEYDDKWGTIKVLGLVFPAAKARAAATAAQTVSPSGHGVLPGGEMRVEDFTAQYVLEGGQW
jgi:hypothetical protein